MNRIVNIAMVVCLIAAWVVAGCYIYKYKELREEVAARELKAEQVARAQEQQWQHDVNAAVDEARKWEMKYEEIAKRNDALVVRLRNTTNSLGQLSGSSSKTCSKYANTVGAVLAECGERYTEMAARADGHANDVRTLMNAWPKENARD